MLLDARQLPLTDWNTDLCIVGSGPAGLVLAQALRDTQTRILILESGSRTNDPVSQELNEGSVTGASYAGLRQTRQRQLGGATTIWNTPIGLEPGAKYTPLEPRDFAAKAAFPWSGWPFGADSMVEYYRRAQEVCGLGPFGYDGQRWSSSTRPCLPLDGTPLVTGVYQFGLARRFTRDAVDDLEAAERITLCYGATAVELVAGSKPGRVSGLVAITSQGTRISVHSRYLVLAAGAVENARLLLAARLEGTDPGDWLGRCFMEHPRDFSLTLRTRNPDQYQQFRFYDQHRADDGTIIAGRLGLHDEAVADGLPATSMTLLPRLRSQETAWLSRLLGRIPKSDPPGYGWSEHSNLRCDDCQLVLNLEQSPDRENRLLLDQPADRHGVPRVRLQWRWTASDQEPLDRLRRDLGKWCEAAGLGRLFHQAGAPPDLNAHHHAGTTRMHEDPHGGVVDPDLKVHGMDNLYVAGASVFPAAGWANPTLTIVALSLKLANHLRTLL